MARHRKPDNVLKMQGTYRKDRHGDPNEKPTWDESFPDMPDVIRSNDAAAAEWNRVERQAPAGVITVTDRTLLTQYCLLVGRLVTNPDEFLAADHTQLRLQAQELGFTPATRGKIGGKPKSEDGPKFKPLN